MRLGLLVVLGGCDVVFGIGHVPDAGPPGPEAPDPVHVMGTYSQHWIENTGGGSPNPMQRAPNVAQITMTATLDDGQTRPVTIDDAGNFTFGVERVGQPYVLEVRSQYLDVEYQLAMSTIAIGERFAGRIDRSLVPAGTDVHMTVTNRPVATPSQVKEELHTTGIWTRPAITTTDSMTFDLDWTTVTAAGGAMGLLDGMGTNHDGAAYTHYFNDGSYVKLDAYKTLLNVTLHPGANTINFGAITTVASFPLCAHLQASMHAEAVRVAAANGSSTAAVYYGVHYIPNAEFAAAGGFPLAYGGTFGEIALASVTDLNGSFQFINPYIGGELRSMTLIFNTSKLPQVGVTSLHTITPGCPAPQVIESGVVGIATGIVLDGKPLSSNDLPLALPKARVELAWLAPSERVDYWVVHVTQVIGASNNAYYLEILTIYTRTPSVTLNTGKLISGNTYRIQIDGVVGDANAAGGDFMYFDAQSLMVSSAITGTFKPTIPQ